MHNDRKLLEFLLLDGAQAGLSWKSILKRRKAYRNAFDNFAAEKISRYKQSDIRSLLQNSGIIRNRLKIESFVNNARRFLETRDEFGTFDRYIWQFVNYSTIQNRYRSWDEIPAATLESEKMSRDLRKRGFTFVGPTICYAFMQTVGMTNDHIVRCFRHGMLRKQAS